MGRVDRAAKSVRFGQSRQYDEGNRPSVAMSNFGVVVEVHETSSSFNSKLWHRVGRIEGEAVKFGPSHDYDNGLTPRVAINDAGLVVEVHKSQGGDTLWYRIGRVSGDRIEFGPSHKYTDGVQPSVALTQDGTVIEAHKSEGLSNALWQRTGKVQGDEIVWAGGFVQFDTGANPSVATNGRQALQVHRGETLPTLWFSNSLLTDRANWMGDRFEALKGKTLRKVSLPASHDSGMYAGNILGRTQNESLYGQLQSGIRYFDLRVNRDLNIEHGVSSGPPVRSLERRPAVHERGQEFAILKFSHYGDGFGADQYNRLRGMITGTIGPWLIPTGSIGADWPTPRWAR